jgi:hypothetical protein
MCGGQPIIHANSIAFMKQLARSGAAPTFLNVLDVGEDVARGELASRPLRDFRVRPLTLKRAIRARGTLDAFPSLVVEELREALPKCSRFERYRQGIAMNVKRCFYGVRRPAHWRSRLPSGWS